MIKAWIPNILSLGNLSLGFLAILISSFPTNAAGTPFQICGFLIFIAAVFDGFDGIIARWLKVESALGKQLDSLADLTTFGIAPAVIMYAMYLKQVTMANDLFVFPLGVLIAMIYPISTAFRLARFNVNCHPGSFQGLPSPISGMMIALMAATYKVSTIPPYLLILLYILMAILMASNIRYAKPRIHLNNQFTIFRLVLLLALLVAASYFFKWYMVVVTIMVFYIFSGIIVVFIHLLQKVKVAFGRINPKNG